MTEADLLARITVDPQIYGGKPIIRGMRLAVEHVLGMLAAGDTPQAILEIRISSARISRPAWYSRGGSSVASELSPPSRQRETVAR